MENTITIYADEEKTISLDAGIMFLIEKMCSKAPSLRMETEDIMFLLDVCYSTLAEQGITPHKPIISPSVPLIKFGKYEKFLPPYEELNWVVQLLSEHRSIHNADTRAELQDKINGNRGGGTYYCHIFPMPIRNTSGFIYMEQDGKSLLLLFAHDEIFLL